MRVTILFCVAAILFSIPLGAHAASSDWLSAPKPKFPTAALKKGSEGVVRLRVVLARDGSVAGVSISKSSGDPVLDEAAREGVSKWKMNPSAIKAADLTKGREEIIDFEQEAVLAAVYPDRKAYFESWRYTDMWMFAPFPSYPLRERQLHHTGTVLLYGRIGDDGQVTPVKVVQSSGYSALDECAVAALRLWRAHKRFAGFQFKIPIRFEIGTR